MCRGMRTGRGGLYDSLILVIPSLDIVVSYNDAHELSKWVNGPDNPTNRAIGLLVDAVQRGEKLKNAVEAKEPGRDFPEWEKWLAKWGRLQFKVRKDVPLEYFE